jgi:ankyrin repeat protein
VQLLLEKGADVDSKDSYFGQTPLSWAAWGGYEAVVRLLLEKGADVDSKSKNGRTPLSRAAWGGHEAVVSLLAPLTLDS